MFKKYYYTIIMKLYMYNVVLIESQNHLLLSIYAPVFSLHSQNICAIFKFIYY